MREVRFLHQLQAVDLEIDSHLAAIEKIDEALSTDDRVQRASDCQKERELELRAAHDRLQELEQEASELETRLKSISAGLYGGVIKNTRELSQMEQEMSHLKEKQGLLEEAEIESMLAVDAATSGLSEARQGLAQARGSWEADSARLAEERRQLAGELEVLQGRRKEMLDANPDLDPGLLSRYERLRKAKWGVAVAMVENGMCTGCRVTLPKATVQECRTAQHLVLCTSCGRILDAGR